MWTCLVKNRGSPMYWCCAFGHCIPAISWVADLQMSRACNTAQCPRGRSFCSCLLPTRLYSILWHCTLQMEQCITV